MLFLREAQQSCAHEWAGCQIEGPLHLFTNQTASLFLTCCFRQTGEVCNGNCERFRIPDDLNRFSMQLAEGRAQSFVSPDEFAQSALERSEVEFAAQAHTARHVVDRIARLELIEEPQSLLSKRERHRIRV